MTVSTGRMTTNVTWKYLDKNLSSGTLSTTNLPVTPRKNIRTSQ